MSAATKVKTCKVCGKPMKIYNSLRKYCSYDCMKKDKPEMQRQKRKRAKRTFKSRFKKRKCATCNAEFFAFRTTDKYCSFKCFPKHVKDRVSHMKRPKTDPLYAKARQVLIEQVMEENGGYIACQHCKKSDARTFEVHHIVYRSERPGHPHMHHQRNLILVCDSCHTAFHDHKELRNQLIKDRKLDKLFDLRIVS